MLLYMSFIKQIQMDKNHLLIFNIIMVRACYIYVPLMLSDLWPIDKIAFHVQTVFFVLFYGYYYFHKPSGKLSDILKEKWGTYKLNKIIRYSALTENVIDVYLIILMVLYLFRSEYIVYATYIYFPLYVFYLVLNIDYRLDDMNLRSKRS
jgi:hypothetical protein